jgi:proline dehydrogenase
MNILNKAIVSVIPVFPRKLVKVFANKYIAGDKLSDAVDTVKRLNSTGYMTTVDVLGESITDKQEAVKSKDENIEVLEAIDKYKLDGNLSVKLTMLGLTIDKELCFSLFKEIADYAAAKNIFIRIDMEDSSVTETTIQLYERIRGTHNNIGIVIQAYLRRSEADVKRLMQYGNFRICKGIYIEPESIAFKDRDEIRQNYLKLVRLILENKKYAGIATHDDYLVNGAEAIVKELGLSKNEYEFQMLLGVRENLRDEILSKGHRVRIYVPFGQRWYEYSIRRFQENPNVAGQVLKSILFRQ